jgi:hypothetical protein
MAYLLSDWQSGVLPPKGWDVADAVADGWGKAEIDAWLRATVKPWTPESAPKRAADGPSLAASPRPHPRGRSAFWRGCWQQCGPWPIASSPRMKAATL